MTFANAAREYKANIPARTANGMKAFSTSKSAVLDLFGLMGSARGVDVTNQFMAALAEDLDLTVRMLLWARDIRGGAGERQTFRTLLASLEKFNPELAGRLIRKVPELGRWDDLFVYADPVNRSQAFAFIREALANKDGLAAKWMPRKGPIAVELTKFLELSPKAYRKLIVGLTNVVESKMCAKEWNDINFSHVPSLASARYQKAFGRNAAESYSAYIRELQKPVAERSDPKIKINAGAVYPYDVVKSITTGNVAVADAQWDALPNFVGDAKIFPIVDTSGSMGHLPFHRYGAATTVQPIDVALSLGLYVSEKNTGDFKDLMMIFDTTPKLVTLKGTLSQRVRMVPEIVAGSTNLHKAFDMLLDIAVKGKVPAEDMPDILVIFSDMQFNCCSNYDDRAQEMIRRKYSEAGYAAPKVVYWNLSMYAKENGNTPVRFDENGTALVSGFSPALMKSVLANELTEFTPYNVMVKTLSADRYAY